MWTAASSQQMTPYRQSLVVAAVVDKRPTNDALKAIARSLRRMLALCLQKKQVFRNHNLAISIDQMGSACDPHLTIEMLN